MFGGAGGPVFGIHSPLSSDTHYFKGRTVEIWDDIGKKVRYITEELRNTKTSGVARLLAGNND